MGCLPAAQPCATTVRVAEARGAPLAPIHQPTHPNASLGHAQDVPLPHRLAPGRGAGAGVCVRSSLERGLAWGPLLCQPLTCPASLPDSTTQLSLRSQGGAGKDVCRPTRGRIEEACRGTGLQGGALRRRFEFKRHSRQQAGGQVHKEREGFIPILRMKADAGVQVGHGSG